MKKVILLLIFSATLNTTAQKNIGVFTGVNYSYFTDGIQKQISAENSFGFQIGVLYDLELSERISFRPKLSYSQQGDRVRTDNDGGYGISLSEIDTKLNYLNLSLDFKFGNKIYMIVGPQIGFLLKQEKLAFNYALIDKNIDLGFNFGGGFQVNKLFFELGFYQGLTTLVSLPKPFSSSSNLDVRNSHLKFTAGYNF